MAVLAVEIVAGRIHEGVERRGAVLPGGAYLLTVTMLWAVCRLPPEVSKLKLDSPTSGYVRSGAM